MKSRLFLSLAVAFLGYGFTARADNAAFQNQLALARVQSTTAKADCPPCPECPFPDRAQARAKVRDYCPPCPACPDGERKLTKDASASVKKGQKCPSSSACPQC